MQKNNKNKTSILLPIIATFLFATCCFYFGLSSVHKQLDAYAERFFQAIETRNKAQSDISSGIITHKETSLLQLTKCLNLYYDNDTFQRILNNPAEEEADFLQNLCDSSDVESILVTDDSGKIVSSNKIDEIGTSVIDKGYYSKDEFSHISEGDNTSIINDETGVSLIIAGKGKEIEIFAPYTSTVYFNGVNYHIIVLADYYKMANNIVSVFKNHSIFSSGSDDYSIVAINTTNETNVDQHPLFYCDFNDENHTYKYLSDLGLSNEVLQEGYKGYQTIGDNSYYCHSYKYQFSGSNLQIIIFGNIYNMVDIFVLVFPILAFLWFSLNIYLKKNLPNQTNIEFKNYTTQLLVICLIGVLVIFGIGFYSETLSSLSSAIQRSNSTHYLSEEIDDIYSSQKETELANNKIGISQGNLIRITIENNPDQYFMSDEEESYRQYKVSDEGGHSVFIMDEINHPLMSISNNEGLKNICRDYNMERVTLYNSDGYVISDSSDVWYGHIERDDEKTADMFAVLDRKKEASVNVTDSSGTIRTIAVPIDYYVCDSNDETLYVSKKDYLAYKQDPDNLAPVKHSYGLLVCEQLVPDTLLSTKTNILDFVTTIYKDFQDCEYIILDDSEEHNVIYPSEIRNSNAGNLNLSDAVFSGEYSGFYEDYFVCSRQYSGEHTGKMFILSLFPLTSLYANRLSTSIKIAFSALVILGALVYASEKQAAKKNNTGLRSYSENRLFVSSVMIVAIVLTYIFLGNLHPNRTILWHILFGSWDRGINLFSLSFCAIIGIILLLISEILPFLGKLLNLLSARDETLARLFVSTIKYAAIIFVVFYSLYLFGLDTISVLRSLGAFSLIVGLGAQSLIKDVIAGIFRVFEGSYHVGDVVEINDVRGKIVEIALRTTKIQNLEGTVITYNNDSITNIKNLSAKESTIFFDINVPLKEKPDVIMTELNSRLPEIRKRHKGIRKDIVNSGIVEITPYAYKIRLIVLCGEFDRGRLWREINYEIIDFMQDMGIDKNVTPIVNKIK